LLEARALHVWRGERHLLRAVSFTLKAGQLLQVSGPNGAGKTTLLRAACGLLPVEGGELLWNGEPLQLGQRREDFNAQLAYLAHTNALKAELTAEENLRYELALRRAVPSDTISAGLRRLGIEQCARLPVRVLSAGQRRRLALARVAACAAPLWVLDEPTTNLDPAGIEVFEQLLLQHLQQGGAVLTAAHHRLLPNLEPSSRLNLQL
jgi:heme exporter protein A